MKCNQTYSQGQVILHDAAGDTWFRFRNPDQTIIASKIEEVVYSLKHIESLVQKHKWYAAGFISYEAASAFDSALHVHSISDFPLLWFGLYPEIETYKLSFPDFSAYALSELAPAISPSDYRRAIGHIKHYIQSGDTYQVNYTLRLKASFQGDPFQLFLAMVHAQSAGYSAWIDTGRYAISSASPELFFRLDGGQLTCKPMKGTVRRGRTLEEDTILAEWLFSSEKNRAENLMIVDMIRNDLGRVAEVGSVQVPILFEVEMHPTLWQMTSTVTAACRRSFAEIMAALFPCASITGAPKIRTTQIIAELETSPRGIYTGSIGFLAPDRRAQFNVAIRTAVVDRDSAQIEYGSGGGIIWDSASEEEYREALLKARVLTERRPEFSLLETLLWTPAESYFLLEYHLRRLAGSAKYFGYPLNINDLRKQLLTESSGYNRDPMKIRLLVHSDGGSEIQKDLIEERESNRILRIMLAQEPVDSADVFLYHKTTFRNIYENARRSCSGYDDVLLWNEREEITESSVANVVVKIGEGLFTPPQDSGLLAGTFRQWLLETGQIHERTIKIRELTDCSRIFLINSVRKWQDAVLCSQGGTQD
ncbi:MAG: aminodeoxychorismate synthase component I [Acidobacteria bacterium]|nr:aminodeoxychorismate synthase component I [Acidobacteriota bacterium]